MNDKLPYFYTTEVTWTSGREGEIGSPGLPTMTVGAPPEFQGRDGLWTPEHFFVASVNSCFMTTFLAIAELSKLEFVSFDCESVAKLEKLEGSGYQITEIILRPRLIIREGKDTDRAARILDKAEKNCLISKSIRTAVNVCSDILVKEHSVDTEQLREELIEV